MSDIEYYRQRAIEEQIAALQAKCPAARFCHDEMAAIYRFRVSQLSNVLEEAGARLVGRRVA